MKRKMFSIPFWLIALGLMYIIFGFSSQTGDESNEVSDGLLNVILTYIGNIVTGPVLRKIAHFSEYCALGFSLSGAIYFTFDSNKFYINLIPCFLYACTDEIHQLFVPDRSCEFTDILIDSCGSLLGIIIFLFIVKFIKKILRQQKEKI